MNGVSPDGETRAQLSAFSVLLVTDVYPPDCGGSGWSTHALARMLDERGHPVEVVSLDPSRDGFTQRVFEGINVVEVGTRRARRNPMRRFGRRDYAHDLLQRYLEERLSQQPEVRLVHGQHLHSGPPAVFAAARHNRGSVVTLRDYWPVCLHGTSWWNGKECPGCTTANITGCMHAVRRWPKPLARLMVPWVRRRLGARREGIETAGCTTTVSRWVRQRIESESPTAIYQVLPNIVDADLTAATARSATPLELPFEGEYLVAAGKLVGTKGFGRMLSALEDAGCTLPVVVAGAGPDLDRLRRQADALPFDVYLPGWVPHTSLLHLIDGAHAFLLPSAWNEPLSRLLLEAMALATPVITWRSGGNPEHLQPGVDAFVVDDAADLRRALDDLARPGRAQDVGRAGERTARDRFAPATVYPRLLEVYRAAMRRADQSGGSDGQRG